MFLRVAQSASQIQSPHVVDVYDADTQLWTSTTLAAPRGYLAVAAVLTSVALGASWFPAWRASRIDPIDALRAE